MQGLLFTRCQSEPSTTTRVNWSFSKTVEIERSRPNAWDFGYRSTPLLVHLPRCLAVTTSFHDRELRHYKHRGTARIVLVICASTPRSQDAALRPTSASAIDC